jgi:APA family basic amino acid/polyamine antiporter
VAAGASGYFLNLLRDFGISFPAAFAAAPLAGDGPATLHLTGAVLNLPAVALVAFLTVFLMAGVSQSARFNAAMVLVKTVIVIAVILFGLPHVTGAHLTPFVPANQGAWGRFGPSGVLAASGMIFFSYLGFETVSAAAQETRNPQRDLPIGILASLGICTLLYMLMALVLVGVTDWRTLNVPNPVSFAIGRLPSLSWLVLPVDIGALAGLTTVAFTSLYGQTRIFYCMARDGFLPRIFAAVNPRCRAPQASTLITGAAAALLAALFPLDLLADLVSIGTLLAFISVCGAVMILRRTAPNAARPFRTPMAGLVAPAGIAACGLMMLSLSAGTWVRLVLWTAIGLAVYFGYSVRHAAPSKWSVRDEG